MLKKEHIFLENREADLINGCVNNDRHFQSALYKKYSGKMMTVCFRYSKNREDAEESLNEGFMKVFDNIGGFKNNGSLEGWIRKIMVNTALEKLRKKSNLYKIISIEDLSLDQRSNENIESDLNAKELIHLIQKLPPMYQIVFNLHVFEGLKHREIAEQLGISEGTSKSNLSDAKTWLKKVLEKLSGDQKALTA
ncbi:MAG: sigma-70 family RNA polymerase sigma factor [Bacteroidetes bacterium]|nr:sigma-70 family RNA polymerase sigma factor [Bacteroidota bacterium]